VKEAGRPNPIGIPYGQSASGGRETGWWQEDILGEGRHTGGRETGWWQGDRLGEGRQAGGRKYMKPAGLNSVYNTEQAAGWTGRVM